MAPELVIRPYRPSDWADLCRIHDAARMQELRLSVGEAAFLTLEQTAEGEGLFEAHVAVAERDGRVAGFAAWSAGELTWLYVDPPLMRSGVGRALLRHAIANAGPEFETEVLVGNEPALQLYLTEGFRIVKQSDGRLTGNEAFAASGYLLARTAA